MSRLNSGPHSQLEKIARDDGALAMNIHYATILEARHFIEEKTGYTLNFLKEWKRDGEAHITVINPVEYKKLLKDHLSIRELNALATQFHIQDSDVHAIGIGRSQALINQKMEETFYVVVQSHNLVLLRNAIRAQFNKNGGDLSSWENDYYPHITVGFTKRDLHASDGAKKDARSLDERFKMFPVKALDQ